MNKGTLFRAHAVKNVFGGDSIARVAGVVVFTPGVIAGEDYVGRVVSTSKDYVRAEVVEILKASPERCSSKCSPSGRCPGCVYSFMSHAEEQRQKLGQLRDFMRPLNVAPEMVQGYKLEEAPEEFYRNKIRLTMRKAGGEAQLGYVFPDGRMYPLSQCRLASEKINQKLSELLADPGFIPSMHDRMTITLRESADGVFCFRNNAGKRLAPLREQVLGRDFKVPADGFFQVNQHGLDALCSLVKTALEELKCNYFIDAYAGSGLFGAVAAAAQVKYIAGVEEDEAAGKTAAENYRNFGAEEFDFRIGDAALLLPEILSAAPETAAVLFDPPRAGLDGKAVRALNSSKIRNVLYVSCHPATLVRDLGRFQYGGFAIEQVRLIDMFPRSGHFETFVQLKR